MNVKKKLVCGALAVACCGALVMALQPDTDKMRQNVLEKSDQSIKDAEKALQDSMPPEMQAWLDAGAPGEEHEKLAKMAGKWTTHAEYWMEPGTASLESEATMKNTMVMDGRYLMTEYDGDMMGMPFQGLGYMAFNNVSGKYQSVWMDSTSTGFMVQEGKDDGKGNIVLVGSFDDPINGEVKAKTVTKMVGDDQYVMEMYMLEPNGNEFKHMVLTHTRAK